jgi:hypothetical protein
MSLACILSALNSPRHFSVVADQGACHLTWGPAIPEGSQELKLHDGIPDDGYYQSQQKLYGTLFDLTSVSNASVYSVEFFSSWSSVGDSCDIVFLDWASQTPVYTIEDYHTTTANNWEYQITLPAEATPESGVLGVFFKPKSGISDDAKPVLAIDEEYDGSSYILHEDYSINETVDKGDFLITLVVEGEDGRSINVAPYIATTANIEGQNILRNETPEISYTSRELGNFRIKRDDNVIVEDIASLYYMDSSVQLETNYTYQVAQIHDDQVSDYTESVEITPRDGMSFELGFYDWMKINNADNDFDWQLSTAGIEAYDGNRCAVSYSYDNVGQVDFETNNWLISPRVSATENATVGFYAAGQDQNYYAEYFNVLVSTNEDPADLDSYTVVSRDTTAFSYERFSYDLSSFNGQEIYFAIQHDMPANEESFALKVDYITFAGLQVDNEDDYIIPVNNTLSNYPNPFNPETSIVYNIANSGNVALAIYNVKGQKVKTLVNKPMTSGEHKVVWNGTDENNNSVASGIYYYKLTCNKEVTINKMLLMK